MDIKTVKRAVQSMIVLNSDISKRKEKSDRNADVILAQAKEDEPQILATISTIAPNTCKGKDTPHDVALRMWRNSLLADATFTDGTPLLLSDGSWSRDAKTRRVETGNLENTFSKISRGIRFGHLQTAETVKALDTLNKQKDKEIQESENTDKADKAEKVEKVEIPADMPISEIIKFWPKISNIVIEAIAAAQAAENAENALPAEFQEFAI